MSNRFLLLASALPAAAWATDYSGTLPFIQVYIVLGPWVLISSIVLLVHASAGTYTSLRKVRLHASIAASLPFIGMLLSLLDRSTPESAALFLALNGVGVLLAIMIPVVAYKRADSRATR
jgi:hypothetical protein